MKPRSDRTRRKSDLNIVIVWLFSAGVTGLGQDSTKGKFGNDSGASVE